VTGWRMDLAFPELYVCDACGTVFFSMSLGIRSCPCCQAFHIHRVDGLGEQRAVIEAIIGSPEAVEALMGGDGIPAPVSVLLRDIRKVADLLGDQPGEAPGP